jgi:pimeloyl-ACP methyl ester carboxylesterase
MKLGRILITAALLSIVLFLWFPATSRFDAHPQPAQDYARAMTGLADLKAKDSNALFPECRSTLLTHGERMTHAIVFFHGIATCPAQFGPLGQYFYEMGYNVLIPRLPHHGWADRMTEDIANLTADELVALADESVDIAHGLGEEVTVVGFSTGGAIAAWVAMERPDVTQTVLISPFLSPNAYPSWTVQPIARISRLLPNEFWWWDEELKEQLPTAPFAYPRYPSHAIAEILRLSFAVRYRSARHSPQSNSILVITNESEHETVDNQVIKKLVAAWQRQGMKEITEYTWDSSLDLEHDYITSTGPSRPENQEELVYATLLKLIGDSRESGE